MIPAGTGTACPVPVVGIKASGLRSDRLTDGAGGLIALMPFAWLHTGRATPLELWKLPATVQITNPPTGANRCWGLRTSAGGLVSRPAVGGTSCVTVGS